MLKKYQDVSYFCERHDHFIWDFTIIFFIFDKSIQKNEEKCKKF